MSLAWTPEALRRATGVTVPELPALRTPLPWYARVVAGTAGWFAALMFLSFVGLLDVFDERHFALLALPAGVCAAGLRRVRLPAFADFKDQLALVLALTARFLLIAGLEALTHDTSVVALGMVAAELAILLAFPDALQRSLSAFAAGSWLVVLVADQGDAPAVDAIAVGATGLALALWAGRGLLERRATDLDLAVGLGPHRYWDTRLLTGLATPVAYGLTMLALGLQLRFSLPDGHARTELFGVGTGLLALAVVAWMVARQRMRATYAAAALLGTAALGVACVSVPGVPLALAFTVVAIRARERLLLGLSATFLAIYGVWFYYDLEAELWAKGAALIASGGLLLAGRLLLLARPAPIEARRRVGGWVALGAVLPLTLLAGRVTVQEHRLATGDPVYLRLAPVDPRSLVQGDYMRLRYQIGREATRHAGAARRGTLVLTVDGAGVGHFERLDTRAELAPDEHRLRYHRRGRRVEVGPRGYLFQEGLAADYERAHYGAFRITPSGHAILVGLADADRQPLGPPRRRW